MTKLTQHRFPTPRQRQAFLGLLLTAVAGQLPAEAPAEAARAFEQYTSTVEARLARQHESAATFLAGKAADLEAARHGQVLLEPVNGGPNDLSGAQLHHWRGTAFVPGATMADIERLLGDISQYRQRFAPQVLDARLVTRNGDRLQTTMRVRQKHILTVVLDSAYEMQFGRLDERHGFSLSHSTRMSEVEGAGTSDERLLTGGREHGYLWRLNTYWSYAEANCGLYLQIETVSLSRSIPHGLGWAIAPLVESVPREGLEFTLRSAAKALRR